MRGWRVALFASSDDVLGGSPVDRLIAGGAVAAMLTVHEHIDSAAGAHWRAPVAVDGFPGHSRASLKELARL
jgi:hypothetical protein